MVRGVGWLLLASSLLLVGGCGPKDGSPAAAPVPVAKAPADPWVLTCVDPKAAEPALLWNGLVGLRLSRSGNGADGKTFFRIDRYESAGEEKIIPLDNPVKIEADEGSKDLADPELMRDYSQRLDMRTGVLTTEWDVDVSTSANPHTKVHLKTEAVLHPTERLFASRWTATPDRDSSISMAAVAPPGGADWEVFQKGGKSAEGVEVNVAKGQPYVWEGVWRFRAKDPVGKPTPGKAANFDDVANAARDVWTSRWKTDIEIDGPVKDQQAVRSFLFYLRSAVHPKGGMGISPFGLSNAQYNGHVFWDADIWCFPALALVDPEAARAISGYRLARFGQAIQNFEEWSGERQTAGGKMGALPSKGGSAGAKYPWESSVTGRETVPGPSRFEEHITGSVAFALRQALQLGLVEEKLPDQVLAYADGYYGSRSVAGPQGREIKDTMSPDELHVGHNDLYTNLLAEWLHRGGTWKGDPKPTYKLPKDDKTFLTYDDDLLRAYKQAAAVLSIYPLQYPPAEAHAKAMMDRFADKVTKNGPAMSDSVNAVIWARLGETDKAYEAWQKSWEPFTTSPLLLFSEKRTRSTTYFTTGAAGSLQSVLFGFLGIRIDWKKEPGAAWTTQLRGDAWLSIKPNLPRSWKSVKFKNFTILGRRYTLTASPSAARVTPGE